MLSESLTIRIESSGEFLDVEDFLSVVDNTLSLLRAVGECMGTSVGKKHHWRIAYVRQNSPLEFSVFSDSDGPGGGEIIRAARRGLQHLEEEQPGMPECFTMDALDISKRIVATLNNGVSRITYLTKTDEPLKTTQRVAAQADELLPKAYEEIGSIEGWLESISVHRKRVFSIWDLLTDDRIECRFSDELFETAQAALRHRVSVSGTIRYDRCSRPVSISVEEIRVLREQVDLPQFADLEKLNLRCDGDVEETMRRSWHGT